MMRGYSSFEGGKMLAKALLCLARPTNLESIIELFLGDAGRVSCTSQRNITSGETDDYSADRSGVQGAQQYPTTNSEDAAGNVTIVLMTFLAEVKVHLFILGQA